MSSEKSKRPKFKHTKELIRIALNDGMTQEEIARLCRVQQSVVSKWNSGKSKAFHDQVARLIERYGARLNRTTARVYLVAQDLPGSVESKLEQTELGRRFLELVQAGEKQESSGTAEPTAGGSSVTWELLRQLSERHTELVPGGGFGDEVLCHLLPTAIVRIEGPIIFRYSFRSPLFRLNSRQNDVDVSFMPVGRWLLHHQVRNRFVLVRQLRRRLIAEAYSRWNHMWKYCLRNARDLGHLQASIWVESADDAARWLSRVHGPMTSDELLTYVDEYLADEDMRHNPHDEAALPFLLRKALVEHGYEVPGLVLMTGSE